VLLSVQNPFIEIVSFSLLLGNTCDPFYAQMVNCLLFSSVSVFFVSIINEKKALAHRPSNLASLFALEKGRYKAGRCENLPCLPCVSGVNITDIIIRWKLRGNNSFV
jgi:hypothetical protein